MYPRMCRHSMLRLYIAVLMFITVLTACDNKDYRLDSPFDNVVYLNVAEIKNVDNFTFKRTLDTGKKEIAAVLAFPSDNDVNVSFAVDPALVGEYNAKHGTDYPMLAAKYYKLSAQEAIITKGETVSRPVSIDFSALTELEIDARYLLPVTIGGVSGGVKPLDGSKTVWYVVTRSSAITTAVSLKGNYFEVPGFDLGSPTADVVNNLTQLTYEAIIRVNNFENEISSIMGIEQHCLLRIADSNFPRKQLMFCSPGDIKFPKADKSKELSEKTWYHVAVTYDTENKTAVMYVDGQEQSRIEEYGNGAPVDLGKQERGKSFMFKIGHSYGEPDDYSRELDGEICEVRVWNVVRSQEEIWKNMYDVDPQTPGLKAYWKFNEGEGNIVKDHTGNGNDAVAHNKAVWPDGIEVPKKNE